MSSITCDLCCNIQYQLNQGTVMWDCGGDNLFLGIPVNQLGFKLFLEFLVTHYIMETN